jgi:hypothetical protein
VELHETVTTQAAGHLLRALIQAVSYRVHTVLTDRGVHFTRSSNTASVTSLIKRALKRRESLSHILHMF